MQFWSANVHLKYLNFPHMYRPIVVIKSYILLEIQMLDFVGHIQTCIILFTIGPPITGFQKVDWGARLIPLAIRNVRLNTIRRAKFRTSFSNWLLIDIDITKSVGYGLQCWTWLPGLTSTSKYLHILYFHFNLYYYLSQLCYPPVYDLFLLIFHHIYVFVYEVRTGSANNG
jgi:hypothetical protein